VRRGAAAAPLLPQYQGPYEVIERGPKFFRIRLGGRVESVSVDRLKPHFSLVPALLGSGPLSSALSGGWAPTSPPSPTLSGGGGRNSRNQLTCPWDFVRTSVKGCLSKSCHQACPGRSTSYFVRACSQHRGLTAHLRIRTGGE